MTDTGDLNPSKLGTKEFWDQAYELEIKNYKDSGDIGEIWFDESSQKRIINWLKKQKIAKDSSIIDIGTGNAAFLIELFNQDYKNLCGVDYSEKSIQLARHITSDEGCGDIKLEVVDILSDESSLLGKFDIIHDKGTFDAIGLMEDAKEMKKVYARNIYNLLKDTGLFIITSCNFIEEELIANFCNHFEKLEVIPSQTFQFGGKTGKTTTSIAFKRKCAE